MDNGSKIINFASSSDAGWWLDSEFEPVAVFVWPGTGDILIKDDKKRKLRLSVGGDKIAGLESKEAEGKTFLFIKFKDDAEPQAIGYSEEPKKARIWVEEVNRFYRAKGQPSNERYGAFWSSIVIRSLFASHEIYYLPGQYVPCTIGKPMEWQWEYLRACKNIVENEFKMIRLERKPKRLELKAEQLIKPRDYGWLVDGIAFKESDNAKIMLPLEIMFEFGERLDRIKIIPLGSVERFQFSVSEGSEAHHQIQEMLDGDKVIEPGRFSSLLNRLNFENFKLVTTSGDATESYLRKLKKEGSWQGDVANLAGVGDYAFIAERLANGYPLAADVGVTKAILAQYGDILRSRIITVDVQYPPPFLRAGMAIRSDDLLWETICKDGWSETKRLIVRSRSLRRNFEKFGKSAKDVGITIHSLDNEELNESRRSRIILP
jgi:hypothetical protein